MHEFGLPALPGHAGGRRAGPADDRRRWAPAAQAIARLVDDADADSGLDQRDRRLGETHQMRTSRPQAVVGEDARGHVAMDGARLEDDPGLVGEAGEIGLARRQFHAGWKQQHRPPAAAARPRG